ncbi:MAG: hypothetical protein AAF480_20455 [Actinomycetota bacterium]
MAVDRAETAAISAGAVSVDIETRWDPRTAMLDEKEYFVEGTATAVAAGPPIMKR